MPNYHRLYVPGGTNFFTLNLMGRPQTHLTSHIDLLRRAFAKAHFAKAQSQHNFETVAIAIMPDHLHCIWTLPPNDDDFSTRWKKIKREFTVEFSKVRPVAHTSRAGERRAWQRRF